MTEAFSRQRLRRVKVPVVSRHPLRRTKVRAVSRQPSRRDMIQAINCRILCAGTRVQIKAKSCGICGGQSGIVAGFSPSTSTFSSQYHSTIAPCSSILHDAI